MGIHVKLVHHLANTNTLLSNDVSMELIRDSDLSCDWDKLQECIGSSFTVLHLACDADDVGVGRPVSVGNYWWCFSILRSFVRELDLDIEVRGDLLNLRALCTHDSSVEILFNFTVDGDHILKILDNFADPGNGGVDAVSGTLEVDLVSSDPISREADHYSSKFISDSPQNLSPSSNKVSVVFGINSHRILNNVVKLFNTSFNYDLCCFNSLLGSNNGDAFSVSIVGSWEDDSGSSFISTIFWMCTPARPIRNLWCCGLAFTSTLIPLSCFSSLSSFRSFTAFSPC